MVEAVALEAIECQFESVGGHQQGNTMNIIKIILLLIITSILGNLIYVQGKESVLDQLSTHGHYYYKDKYILCAIKEDKNLLIYKVKPTIKEKQ